MSKREKFNNSLSQGSRSSSTFSQPSGIATSVEASSPWSINGKRRQKVSSLTRCEKVASKDGGEMVTSKDRSEKVSSKDGSEMVAPNCSAYKEQIGTYLLLLKLIPSVLISSVMIHIFFTNVFFSESYCRRSNGPWQFR